MMYKKIEVFTKKSFFSLFFMLILAATGSLLFNSCTNLFEESLPVIEEKTDTSETPLPAGEPSLPDAPVSGTESANHATIIVKGQLFINGAVPEEIVPDTGRSENAQDSASDRAAVPAYVASEVQYFATATNGSTTINGSFGSGNAATTFEIPLTEGLEWSITCGLKKISSGDVLFSATTDDDIDPADLADDAVLQFFPTPDTSGGASSTGEIDLSMTVASTITS